MRSANNPPTTAASQNPKSPTRNPTEKPRFAKGAVTIGPSSIREQMIHAHGASKSLEAEYIRSLHKQIFLLELENKYIREELDKAKGPSEMKVETARRSDDMEMLRGCCETLQGNLDREAASRKEQLDLFTRDLAKARNERDTILKEKNDLNAVIEALQQEIKNQEAYVDLAEKRFASLKQTLTDEIRQRKSVERKLRELSSSFRQYEENMRSIGTSTKHDQPSPQSSLEGDIGWNNVTHDDILEKIARIHKQMKTQHDEIKHLKELVSTSEPPPAKLENDDAVSQSESRKDSFLPTAQSTSAMRAPVSRRRWQNAEIAPLESGVQEDAIEPTKKPVKPSLKL